MTKTGIDSAEAVAEGTTAVDATHERRTKTIGELWEALRQHPAHTIEDRDDLNTIRRELGRRLYDAKAVLACPGSHGAWSGFLQLLSCPRSTADRLVRAYALSVSSGAASCLTGATDESIEAVVQRRVKALWPKLSQALRTPESVELFIVELRRTAERSLATDVNAASSAPPAPGYESQAGAGLCDGEPPSSARIADTLQPADPKDECLVETEYPVTSAGAESSVPEDGLARRERFRSRFLIGVGEDTALRVRA
jgi:hypothetical protein